MDPLSDTVEMQIASDFEILAEKYFGLRGARTRVTFGALSDVGKVRKNNEDHYSVVRRQRSRDVLFTSLPPGFLPRSRDEAYVMVVADGMGGAAFGEVASMLALRTGWDLTTNAFNWPFLINDREAEKVMEQIKEYGKRMHEALIARGRVEPKLAGMGSTITGALLIGSNAFIGHVGDSRAYLLRDRTLKLLTHDHTKAQQLVDAGFFESVEEAPNVMRHILVNCLGGSRNLDVRVDTAHLPLADGDKLLLCTDGLTDMVTDEEITSILSEYPEPAEASRALVQSALDHGGKDNVTVLLACIAVEEPGFSGPANE
jgi:PPM family protein phosphatase